MKLSEQTDALFSAVSKMQSELTNASKDKQGHGYKYADLAECIETAKQPLANNGLAVVQMMGMADGIHTLTTMLTHSSGQYVCDTMRIEDAVLQGGAGKNPAQVMGASITYMRRYAFAAIIGLAQEDDDAAVVGKKTADKQPAYNPQPDIAAINACQTIDALKACWSAISVEGQKHKAVISATNKRKAELSAAPEPITERQKTYIQTHYNGRDRDDRLAEISKMLGRNVGSVTDLTKDEATVLIDKLETGVHF